MVKIYGMVMKEVYQVGFVLIWRWRVTFRERLISAEERTLYFYCLNLFSVNVNVVTALKINCKAHGKEKGKGRFRQNHLKIILDNLPLELTLNFKLKLLKL